MNVYNTMRHRLVTLLGQAVSDTFKILLSEKHLYQCAEVDWNLVSESGNGIEKEIEDEYASAGMRPFGAMLPDDLIDEVLKIIPHYIWVPDLVAPTSFQVAADSIPVNFQLPTINTFCQDCKDRWPFNPVAPGSSLIQGNGQDEIFYLGYQCQQCKGEAIRFLVRREGLKIQLAGRYPLEVLPTPKVLPKSVSKFYGNAVIAHHAGQTLAGLFLLRVFIEQFWRSQPAIKKLVAEKPRANGDEQGSEYQSSLPPEFNSRFPSLKDVYGKLSEAIHTANEDAILFDDSCAKILKHFDARRVFEI